VQLDEIHAAFAQDCKIDRLDLEGEALNCPNLQAKWIRMWSDERLRLAGFQNEMKRLRLTKDIYYDHGPQKGEKDEDGEWKRPPGKILKQKIPLHVDADEDVLTLTTLIEISRTKVDVLNSYMTSMAFRKSNIETVLQIRKYESGG
jgi:hypothetical protein